MALDGMMTKALREELEAVLVGGKVNKIYQPGDRDLVFTIRAKGVNHRLFLSANPTYPRLYLTDQSYQNPVQAPLFCMLLRKNLIGGIITNVQQVGIDRILYIDVRTLDELGDEVTRRVVVELMGKHSNIILLDSEREMIMDCIHHVGGSINQYRVLLPGQPYVSPPAQHKDHPLQVDENTLLRKVNFNEGKLDRQIVNQFAGISPLLAKEIVFRAGIGDRTRLAHAFTNTMQQIRNKEYEPCRMFSEQQEWFYLFPLQHVQAKVSTYSSVSKMLEAYFHGKAERDRHKQRAHDIVKFVLNEKKKNEKKHKKLQQTIKNADIADRYQLYGELLTTYMHQVEHGQQNVELENYYEPGTTVTIQLDADRTPNENAQLYFKKYTKTKTSKVEATKQLKITEQEIAYLEQVLHQLEHASFAEMEEIRDELADQGYLRKRQANKQKKRNKQTDPQPLKYESSDGSTILVGKNNRQNEYVTNRLANRTDTWLHTKDIPGSHVVIRSQSFSEQTLLEAAQLAAYHSKASQSSQVPVDYTQIRHVRKPNGAKPGFVIYDHQKTVFVNPQDCPLIHDNNES